MTFPALTQSRLTLIMERIGALQMLLRLDGLGALRKAYPYMPADLPSAQLPFTVNQVMPSSVPYLTPGLYWVTDEIDMTLCLARWQGDTAFDRALAHADRWRDLMLTTFAAHVRLSPPDAPGVPDFDFVVDAIISTYTGSPAKIALGSSEFLGFNFRLTVREYLFTPVSG